MDVPLDISSATIEDAPSILELQRLAYRSEAERYDDFTILPLIQSLEDLTLSFATHLFLKVEIDNRIVGSVRAQQDRGTCRIGRLIVHPDFQGHGIGTALMKRIEAHFPTAERFELFTGHKSAGNIRLYERLGYVTFREERVSDKLTLVFMEKK